MNVFILSKVFVLMQFDPGLEYYKAERGQQQRNQMVDHGLSSINPLSNNPTSVNPTQPGHPPS